MNNWANVKKAWNNGYIIQYHIINNANDDWVTVDDPSNSTFHPNFDDPTLEWRTMRFKVAVI